MNDLRHDIERYQKGEMSPQEMHALERKALDDPFLADALEGASMLSAQEFESDVQDLQHKVFHQQNSAWFWTLRIAAAVTFLAVASFILWPFLSNQEDSKDLAMEQRLTTEEDDLNEAANELESASESEPTTTEDEDASIPDAEETETSSQLSGKPESAAKNDGDKGPAVVENLKQAEIARVETKPLTSTSISNDSTKVSERFAGLAKAKTTDDNTGKGENTQTEPVLEPAKETEIAVLEEQRKKEAVSRSLARDQESRKRAAAPQPAAAESLDVVSSRKISGFVTSSEDGSPLPGVNVVIKGTTIGTVTDISGNYEIFSPVASPTLEFSFIGLQSKEISVPATQSENNVSMAADATQLSEVIVTGYSQAEVVQNESTTELAHPEIGYREFKKYLEQNIRYPQEAIEKKVEGRVTVEFTVESNGSLSEFIVLRGIGSGCDDELIRLIRESKWIPTKQNRTPVKDKARVRLKFDLPKN